MIDSLVALREEERMITRTDLEETREDSRSTTKTHLKTTNVDPEYPMKTSISLLARHPNFGTMTETDILRSDHVPAVVHHTGLIAAETEMAMVGSHAEMETDTAII